MFLEENSGGDALFIDGSVFETGAAPQPSATQYFNYFVPAVTSVDWFDISFDVYDYVVYSCNNNDDYRCCIQPYCCRYTSSNPGSGCTVNCLNQTTRAAFLETYLPTVLLTEQLRNMFRQYGYTNPPNGAYPISVTYSLPGLGIQTSVKSLNLIKNP